MRVILYTGKGGVGKTSMAAATAVKMAKAGRKVLVMSTDRAHSLSDSFGVVCKKEPTAITDNLDAMEIDAVYESEKSWAGCKDYLKRLLTSRGDSNGIEVEELLVFPGFEELLCMVRVLHFVEEGNYDVIILDCAPTGETLSLLKYPEMLSGLIKKFLPMKKVALKVAGPTVEKTMKIPMPEESLYDEVEHIMDRLEDLQKLMLDKDIVSVRIVTTPEQIVLSEARRNFTCMHLFDYNVDAIIVNKIYPAKAMDGYFSKWLEVQEKNLKEIDESFSEVPKLYMELQNEEIVGTGLLSKIGDKLWKDMDPGEILFREKIYEADEKAHVLKIYLPFAEKSDLDLTVVGNEIVLAFRNETRRFPIPAGWSDYSLKGAKMQDNRLCIEFV